MVCAMEFKNLLIDGAMPVEARKKPKSMATNAGPALIAFCLISTTKMMPNIRTTDSDRATTDHTLGRNASPALGHAAHTPGTHRATNSLPIAGG